MAELPPGHKPSFTGLSIIAFSSLSDRINGGPFSYQHLEKTRTTNYRAEILWKLIW